MIFLFHDKGEVPRNLPLDFVPGSTGTIPPACVKEATIASEIQRIAYR